MKKALQIFVLSLLPSVSLCQNASEDLFTESLLKLSKSEKVKAWIGTTHENRNALFYFYKNKEYYYIPEDSSEYAIYVWKEKYLFDKPVSCYMCIDSLVQTNNKLYLYYSILGKGNEACDLKLGIAKFKIKGEAKLELTKIKAK